MQDLSSESTSRPPHSFRPAAMKLMLAATGTATLMTFVAPALTNPGRGLFGLSATALANTGEDKGVFTLFAVKSPGFLPSWAQVRESCKVTEKEVFIERRFDAGIVATETRPVSFDEASAERVAAVILKAADTPTRVSPRTVIDAPTWNLTARNERTGQAVILWRESGGEVFANESEAALLLRTLLSAHCGSIGSPVSD